MPELIKKVNLNYLTKEEIIDFYQLFFGNILIKKNDFSYVTNLTKTLSNDSLKINVINKLNTNESAILKLLSTNVFYPYHFITEKINIILNLPSTIINKAIANLIEKKYVFLRTDNTLVVPDIYFKENRRIINFNFENDQPINEYSSKVIIDINNLINYFISREIKTSNSKTLYKKDLEELRASFSKNSTLKDEEFNIIAYFFSLSFTAEEETLVLENIQRYFSQLPLDKVFYFIKIAFPWFYSILMHVYKLNKTVTISTDDFSQLWIYTFLTARYTYEPFRINLDRTLKFFNNLGIIKLTKETVTIPIYLNNINQTEDDMRLSSNYNFYINANSMRKDFYMPALFSNFKKYNKIVEYEITETSIKKCILNGITLDEVIDYLNSFNTKISKNVDTTIRQWFDKYASYFYSCGTIFFCKNPDKAKLIKSLINKNLIKAYEIIKDEVFLIPKEIKNDFFEFLLDKTGINYYYKKPRKPAEKIEDINIDISAIFKNKVAI